MIVTSAPLPAAIPLPDSTTLEYLWVGQERPSANTCGNCDLVYKNFHLSDQIEQEIYNRWRAVMGPRWAGASDCENQPRSLMALLEAHFFEINGRPPQSIIDVGAGEGGYLDDVVEIERYSLDINEQSALENSNRGIKGIVADICSDKFTVARKFDVITCFDVLEHLRAPDTALKNIASLLRPGGIFVAETGNITSPIPVLAGIQNWWYVNIPEHKIFWHEALLRKSLRKWGLQITHCQLRGHKGRPIWSAKNLAKLSLFLAGFCGDERPFRKIHMKDHLYFTSTKLS